MITRIQAPELVSGRSSGILNNAAPISLRVDPGLLWRRIYLAAFHSGWTTLADVVWQATLEFKLKAGVLRKWTFDWRQSDGSVTAWPDFSRAAIQPPFWVETIASASANPYPTQPGVADEMLVHVPDIVNSDMLRVHLLPIRTYVHCDEIVLTTVGTSGAYTGTPTRNALLAVHSTQEQA